MLVVPLIKEKILEMFSNVFCLAAKDGSVWVNGH